MERIGRLEDPSLRNEEFAKEIEWYKNTVGEAIETIKDKSQVTVVRILYMTTVFLLCSSRLANGLTTAALQNISSVNDNRCQYSNSRRRLTYSDGDGPL